MKRSTMYRLGDKLAKIERNLNQLTKNYLIDGISPNFNQAMERHRLRERRGRLEAMIIARRWKDEYQLRERALHDDKDWVSQERKKRRDHENNPERLDVSR
jgi:hypothetical protein